MNTKSELVSLITALEAMESHAHPDVAENINQALYYLHQAYEAQHGDR